MITKPRKSSLSSDPLQMGQAFSLVMTLQVLHAFAGITSSSPP